MTETATPKVGGKRHWQFPFHELQVGDSFLSPCLDDPDRKRRLQIRISASSIVFSKSRSGGTMKFKTKMVEGGVRVWRIR